MLPKKRAAGLLGMQPAGGQPKSSSGRIVIRTIAQSLTIVGLYELSELYCCADLIRQLLAPEKSGIPAIYEAVSDAPNWLNVCSSRLAIAACG